MSDKNLIQGLRELDRENKERKNRYLELLEKCDPEEIPEKHICMQQLLLIYM